MATSNRTTYAILGFLTHRPMSGYDIKQQIEGSTENFWSESFGQIYPILGRLTEQGLIEKEDGGGAGKRTRHVYTITEAGREALLAWLHEPTAPPKVRIELLLKLFFGGEIDGETQRRHIETYRTGIAADVERYREIHRQLEAGGDDEEALPYWLLTLSYGERVQQAVLDWCDEALKTVDRLEKKRQAKR